MQKIWLVGNVTGDPQSRVTQSGKSVCSFTIAVNRRNKKDEADFFRISAWNQLGENCQKYLAKGRKVAVTGSVSVSTYKTQTGEFRANMDVMAEEVEFLTPKSEGQTKVADGYGEPIPKGYEQVKDDGELPF